MLENSDNLDNLDNSRNNVKKWSVSWGLSPELKLPRFKPFGAVNDYVDDMNIYWIHKLIFDKTNLVLLDPPAYHNVLYFYRDTYYDKLFPVDELGSADLHYDVYVKGRIRFSTFVLLADYLNVKIESFFKPSKGYDGNEWF